MALEKSEYPAMARTITRKSFSPCASSDFMTIPPSAQSAQALLRRPR